MTGPSITRALITALAFGWGVLLMMPDEAEAHDPQSSPIVSSVNVTISPVHEIDTDYPTVYAGIADCSALVSANPAFDVLFEALVSMQNPDYFGGVYHYNFARGEERAIACRTSDGSLHEDCAGEISSGDYTLIGGEVDVDVSFETLTEITNADVCDQGELDRSYYVQLRLRRQAATGVGFTEWSYAEARLVLDLVRPETPVLHDALVTENSIYVEFEASPSEDVRRHYVVYSSSPFEAGSDARDLNRRALSSSATEDGRVTVSLEAGSTVHVGVAARDRAGNFSTTSDSISVTVMETNTFWDYYVGAGGSDEGGYGCQVMPAMSPLGAVLSWLLIVAAWLGIRRLPTLIIQTEER